jgi:hypothetical protein
MRYQVEYCIVLEEEADRHRAGRCYTEWVELGVVASREKAVSLAEYPPDDTLVRIREVPETGDT